VHTRECNKETNWKSNKVGEPLHKPIQSVLGEIFRNRTIQISDNGIEIIVLGVVVEASIDVRETWNVPVVKSRLETKD